MSLDREGELRWKDLSAAQRLSPGRLRALVLSEKSDVRTEIRRRLEALAGTVVSAVGAAMAASAVWPAARAPRMALTAPVATAG